MKIAFFTDNFYPELSGVADSVTALARELGALGHQVAIFAPRYAGKNYAYVGVKNLREPDLGPNVRIVRLSSIGVPVTPQGRLVNPFAGAREFKKFDPDLVHTQHFFGVGLAGLRLARKFKKPFVGTNHTSIVEMLKTTPFGSGWITRIVLRFVLWYYGKCLFITTPSRFLLEEMRDQGFTTESHILSNPIATDVFHPSGEKEALKTEFDLSTHTIVHFGRLSPERKIEVIVRAMPLVLKEVPDAMLALVGDGFSRRELERLARTLKIEGRVRFFGTFDKERLARIVNASEAFAITSTAETQSLTLMNSMACGLPVIGVKARALPEYIPAEAGFIIEPSDIEALARKIVYLFKYPEQAKTMGLAGYRFAQNFSAPAIAKEWEHLYRAANNKYRIKA